MKRIHIEELLSSPDQLTRFSSDMATCESWLLTTGANRPGTPSATVWEIIATEFCNEVDCFIDGGGLFEALPSTIFNLGDDGMKILRQGAVEINTQL